MIKIYLAGAIRDGIEKDITWRETFIDALWKHAIVLSPLAGKVYNPKTKEWFLHGLPSLSEVIVPHDFWMVDRSDLIVFNFLALAEGYPNIGTLVEFGHATAGKCLIYSIIPKDLCGANACFKLHPFLKENSHMIFSGEDDCLAFLMERIKTLSGINPRFSGIIE